MSVSLSGDELINLAIDIERRGIAFYDIMARTAENDAAREAFRYLVEMEREHVRTFQSMLSNVGESRFSKDRTQVNTTYLQALADSAVFTEDMATGETAAQIASDIGALEYLVNLSDLYVRYNQVSDLSALVANDGIGSGDTVGLTSNPLSQTAIDVQIPALEARGVTVLH